MTEGDVMEEDHAQRRLEVLNNPIWFALTTEHRFLARSHGHARRYPPDVSPLAALLHPTNDAFADLRRLVSFGEHVAVFTASPLDVPCGWHVDRSRWIDQIICEASLEPPIPSLVSGVHPRPTVLRLAVDQARLSGRAGISRMRCSLCTRELFQFAGELRYRMTRDEIPPEQ